MKIEIEEKDVIRLLVNYFNEILGPAADVNDKNIIIETKSKQNYKAEWEQAAFRVRFQK